MHLTPEILESAYEFLRTTPPFKRWKLPDADAVEFVVGAHKEHEGYYEYQFDSHGLSHHRITIYQPGVRTTDEMLPAMAHEMVHLHQLESEWRKTKRVRSRHHGKKFLQLLQQVKRAHGWPMARLL